MNGTLSSEKDPHDEVKINRRRNFLLRLPEYIKKDLIKNYGFDKSIYANRRSNNLYSSPQPKIKNVYGLDWW
jgi:hypothetical protein